MVVFEKKQKTEKCSQKALRSYWDLEQLGLGKEVRET